MKQLRTTSFCLLALATLLLAHTNYGAENEIEITQLKTEKSLTYSVLFHEAVEVFNHKNVKLLIATQKKKKKKTGQTTGMYMQENGECYYLPKSDAELLFKQCTIHHKGPVLQKELRHQEESKNNPHKKS